MTPRLRFLTTITVCTLAGCAATKAPRPIRKASILISGDTAGWIVPCGCTSNQSGGLPRRAMLVNQLRSEGDTLVVDAGGAPGGSSVYHRAKFEAVLRGERAMNVVAHNLGGPEVALGADELRRLASDAGVLWLSANVRDASGQRIGEAVRISTAGGQRIAFVGVVSPRYAAGGLTVSDPRDAALAAVQSMRGRFDALVVLAYLPEDELRPFAASFPEADAVVGGPTGQSIAPTAIGPTLLAAATNKGKFVVRLDVGSRGHWSGNVVELGPTFSDDLDQTANVARLRAELAQRDIPAGEAGLTPALPAGLPASYRIAGSDRCQKCHGSDCQSWTGSRHAHAWEPLTAQNAAADPHCQMCHTTGYGLPGGFESVARSVDRRGVGCESCHGPSQAHVQSPRVKTSFAARDQCSRCHDRENSPTFNYDPFWDKIRLGAPATKGSGS